MSKVYQYVTDRIIADLKNNTIPWNKPWSVGTDPIPHNWATGRHYTGVNRLLLEPGGQYATYNQIKNAGGEILKDTSPAMVVFWKLWEKDKNTDEEKKIPVFRYYKVWEIGQTTLERKQIKQLNPDIQTQPDAEAILNDERLPEIRYGALQAAYHGAEDYIELPAKTSFISMEDFYATAYHEIIHSTKHHTRLNRNKLKLSYSMEELTAEIGSAFLLQHHNMYRQVSANIAAYCDHWLNTITNAKLILYLNSKHHHTNHLPSRHPTAKHHQTIYHIPKFLCTKLTDHLS